MGKDAVESIVTVITAVIVVALVAVLVSQNAKTGDVLTAGGNALSNVIKAAVSPVNSAATTEVGNVGYLGL